ncbi:MAG: ABC-type cobalamin/Fe3+-siderophore transport system, ATPase component [Deltaproteobacteria bacterium]|nr:ABC-type cobalamin/Fe3+-siderophore transport system, ATPase component [Deltaproteobacteria bacterium]
MTEAPHTLLSLAHVTFRYRAVPALNDVSLDLTRGEILGILGPNGSGKSTMLRIMSGVLHPQSGTVDWLGSPLSRVPRTVLARQMAVVPQGGTIEFPFSVMEVVLMGRAPHLGGFAFEGDQDVQVAEAAMRRTGTLDLAHRCIHELSGGERQRVILARALAQVPQALLLDEPGAFLDIRHAVELYDLLRDLQAEGMTIATVLHDLNLAALYCDRVALLKAGRLVRLGPPAEVISYATVRDVYETEVYVDTNDITGAVNVLPLSRVYRERLKR